VHGVAQFRTLGHLIMRRLFPVCLFLLISIEIHADTTNTVSVSPDGKYSICNVEIADKVPLFVIKSKDGKVLSVKTSPEGALAEGMVSDVQWSRDGKLALFCVGAGRNRYACVFSTSDKKTNYIYPEDEYNFCTDPVRWINPRAIIVEVSGPHNNAGDPFIRYRKTYRVTTQPLEIECIYTGPKDITPPE